MASATNSSGYDNPGMGGAPRGNPAWGGAAGPGSAGPWGYQGAGYQGAAYPGNGYPDGHVWYWQWRHAGRPLWLIAALLGFMFWWPVGLFLLVWCTFGGRRMSCWGYGRPDGYEAGWQGGPPPWMGWRRHFKRQMREWCRAQAQGQGPSQGPGPAPAYPPSGNRAFDEYRAETLRRLEEEQKEFGSFLERLRFAKDKAEFDQFMAELRQRPPAPPSDQPAPPAAG